MTVKLTQALPLYLESSAGETMAEDAQRAPASQKREAEQYRWQEEPTIRPFSCKDMTFTIKRVAVFDTHRYFNAVP